MEFKAFQSALKVVAEKVFSTANPSSAYEILLKDFILPLITNVSNERGIGNEEIFKLMELLKDPEMVKLLGIVHKTLIPYYLAYANKL
jgi:uncharacterized protein YjgD (DUF1641 family)